MMQEISTYLNKYIHAHIIEKSTIVGIIGINVILLSHHYQKYYPKFSKFRVNECM